MKIALNRGIGRFSISIELAKWMAARGHEQAKAELEEYEIRMSESGDEYWGGRGFCAHSNYTYYDRTDPLLIEGIEILGKVASTRYSTLEVIDIPDDIDWYIDAGECGIEWVAEKHRTWPEQRRFYRD